MERLYRAAPKPLYPFSAPCKCGDVDCYACGIYGHVAKVERRVRGSAHPITGLGGRTEMVEVRRKGRRRAVERAARLTSGFVRLVSVEALSHQAWLGAFGEGRS